MIRRILMFLPIFLVQMGLDQWTKHLATEYLKNTPARTWLADSVRLQYATNEGAFLSLGANLPPPLRYWTLTILVGALLLGLTIYALASKKLDQVQVAAYSLIASGGFSNWIDRVRFEGSVVDFMNLGIGWLRTGVFNVADLAILGGIGVLFVQSYQEEKRQKAVAAARAGEAPPA